MGINFPGDVDERTCQFLISLFNQTAGDLSQQASMYEIGERMGLDKAAASHEAENVMAAGWAEVRTLSGGIGITEAGVDAARTLGVDTNPESKDIGKLGSDVVVEEAVRQGVDMLVAALKCQTQSVGLEFEDLVEFLADLRTIDAQLASSRPKAAILRACFESVRELMKSAGITENLDQVNRLLAP